MLLQLSSSGVPWVAELTDLRFDPVGDPLAFKSPLDDGSSRTDWECSKRDGIYPFGSSDREGKVTCDQSVVFTAAESTEFRVYAEVSVGITDGWLQDHLEVIDWDRAPAEHRHTLEDLLARHHDVALSASSEPMVIAFPRSPWPAFLTLVAALLIAVLLLRIVKAFYLRRWAPLVSPEYLVVPLEHQEDIDLNVCTDLVRRAARADLAHMKMRSGWLRPLFSLPRRIKAKAEGDCWSTNTNTRRRKTTAIIGTTLAQGWTAIRCPDGLNRVIIWDLPSEEERADWQAQISAIKAQAAATWEEIQKERCSDDDAEESCTPVVGSLDDNSARSNAARRG